MLTIWTTSRDAGRNLKVILFGFILIWLRICTMNAMLICKHLPRGSDYAYKVQRGVNLEYKITGE